MVYILLKTYLYEFSEVVGAYSSVESAEAAKEDAIKNDSSLGAGDYDIIETELE